MRKSLIMAILAAASTPSIAAADYYLKIEGVSRPSVSGPIYLKVSSSGDLDGDGVPDEGIVRLNCTGGKPDAAHFHYNVKSPRDSASGMASGKRTHHPVIFVKEWGAATPQLAKMRPTYDVKTNKGARMTADAGGWTAISLSGDELCPAAESAAQAVINTSRSNVKNQ